MTFPNIQLILKQASILLAAAGFAALISAFTIHSGKLAEMRTEGLGEGEITLTMALKKSPQPLWIDARSEAEYDDQHIPEALLLNEKNWAQQAPGVIEKWEPGRSAVVYCASPALQASREVAERLRDFKLGPVFVLHGGWKAWERR